MTWNQKPVGILLKGASGWWGQNLNKGLDKQLKMLSET